MARRSGRSRSAIRYYEAQGLLGEVERVAGRREFSPAVLERLCLIEVGQQAGFSLPEIRALLESGSDFTATLSGLARHRAAEVAAQIERLQVRREWLEAASECGCSEPRECELFAEPACAPAASASA